MNWIKKSSDASELELEMYEYFLELMFIYVDENPTLISQPYFHETMMEEIELFVETTLPIEGEGFMSGWFERINGNAHVDAVAIINVAAKDFYEFFYAKRSYIDTFVIPKTAEDIKTLVQKLNYLDNLKQPEQKTAEWYEYRNNLITASNAYKCFDTVSSQNQIIYEKCKCAEFVDFGMNTSMHWGQKYERVSVMYYEYFYDTNVKEYGCIQHPKYPFLGASPDGIVCSNSDNSGLGNRYGRMLEIKNVVSREINGIPKKEYWTQMQLQMEVCDLDECDFLETKFVEYENEHEFKEDQCLFDYENEEKSGFYLTAQNDFKGIILYFSASDTTTTATTTASSSYPSPKYIYKPLLMGEKEFERWKETQIEHYLNQGYMWIKDIYWKLEEISCVLVLRNRKWFKDNVQTIGHIWKTIEREKASQNFEHRAPKKRDSSKNMAAIDNYNLLNKCFIKITKTDVDADADAEDVVEN
jgi:hypothetical protein